MQSTTSTDTFLQLLLDIKKDTSKMARHVDRVERHISWVEKLVSIFLPSLFKKEQIDDIDILGSVV